MVSARMAPKKAIQIPHGISLRIANWRMTCCPDADFSRQILIEVGGSCGAGVPRRLLDTRDGN